MTQAQTLDNLTQDVEELLGTLGPDQKPEIRDLRERLNRTIAQSKQAVAEAAAQAGETIKNYAVTVDDFVHESPWLAVGTAVVTAGALGFLAGTLFASSRRGGN